MSKSGKGMNCFNHKSCGNKSLASTVLLLCECLVCLCPECARKSTLICLSQERQRRKVQSDSSESISTPYEAYFSCPQCSFKVTTKHHSIIHGVDGALEAQEELLRAAMTDVGKSYFKYTTNLVDLQECYKLLHQQNDLSEPENGASIDNETVTIAKLRHSIVAFALTLYEGYDNPLRFLSFTENRLYHYHITDTKDEYSSRCIACLDAIQPGFSVQLTCACKYQLCRTCVLINVHIRPETYHNGVHCVLCKQPSRGILMNTGYVASCEQALVQSALLYSSKVLTIKDTRSSDSERINLLTMIKLYQCIGYEGNLDVLNEKERDLAALPRLRLEVAKLEESRLNRLGIIDTFTIHYDTAMNTKSGKKDMTVESANTPESPAGRFPLGFLHALQVTKNTFFEHFFIPHGATKHDAVSNSQIAFNSKCSAILAQLQVTSNKNRATLSLLENLVLLSIRECERIIRPGSSVSATTVSYYTVDRIVQLVAQFVQTKFTDFDMKLIKSEDNSVFMATILKKLSAKSVIEKSVIVLVKLKLLIPNSKAPVEYSLDLKQYLRITFDPVFMNAEDAVASAAMIAAEKSNLRKAAEAFTAPPLRQSKLIAEAIVLTDGFADTTITSTSTKTGASDQSRLTESAKTPRNVGYAVTATDVSAASMAAAATDDASVVPRKKAKLSAPGDAFPVPLPSPTQPTASQAVSVSHRNNNSNSTSTAVEMNFPVVRRLGRRLTGPEKRLKSLGVLHNAVTGADVAADTAVGARGESDVSPSILPGPIVPSIEPAQFHSTIIQAIKTIDPLAENAPPIRRARMMSAVSVRNSAPVRTAALPTAVVPPSPLNDLSRALALASHFSLGKSISTAVDVDADHDFSAPVDKTIHNTGIAATQTANTSMANSSNLDQVHRNDDRTMRVVPDITGAIVSAASSTHCASSAGSSSAHPVSLVSRVRAKRTKAPPVSEQEEKDPDRFSFRGMKSTPQPDDSDWSDYVRYIRTHKQLSRAPDKSKRKRTKVTPTASTKDTSNRDNNSTICSHSSSNGVSITTRTSISKAPVNSMRFPGGTIQTSTSLYPSESEDECKGPTSPPGGLMNVWDEQNESWTTQSTVYKPIKKRQLVEVYNVDSDSAEDTKRRNKSATVAMSAPSFSHVNALMISGSTSSTRDTNTAPIDLTGPSNKRTAVIDRFASLTSGEVRGRNFMKVDKVADPQFVEIRSKWTGASIASSSHSGAVGTLFHADLTTNQPAVLSSGKNESNMVLSKSPLENLSVQKKSTTVRRNLLEPPLHLAAMANGEIPMTLLTSLLLISGTVDTGNLVGSEIIKLMNRAEDTVAVASKAELLDTIGRLSAQAARRESIIAIVASLEDHTPALMSNGVTTVNCSSVDSGSSRSDFLRSRAETNGAHTVPNTPSSEVHPTAAAPPLTTQLNVLSPVASKRYDHAAATLSVPCNGTVASPSSTNNLNSPVVAVDAGSAWFTSKLMESVNSKTSISASLTPAIVQSIDEPDGNRLLTCTEAEQSYESFINAELATMVESVNAEVEIQYSITSDNPSKPIDSAKLAILPESIECNVEMQGSIGSDGPSKQQLALAFGQQRMNLSTALEVIAQNKPKDEQTRPYEERLQRRAQAVIAAASERALALGIHSLKPELACSEPILLIFSRLSVHRRMCVGSIEKLKTDTMVLITAEADAGDKVKSRDVGDVTASAIAVRDFSVSKLTSIRADVEILSSITSDEPSERLFGLVNLSGSNCLNDKDANVTDELSATLGTTTVPQSRHRRGIDEIPKSCEMTKVEETGSKREESCNLRGNSTNTLTIDDFDWSDTDDEANPTSAVMIDNIVTEEDDEVPEPAFPVIKPPISYRVEKSTVTARKTSAQYIRIRFEQWFDKHWNPQKKSIEPMNTRPNFNCARAVAYIKKAKKMGGLAGKMSLAKVKLAEEIIASAKNERVALALGHLQFVGTANTPNTHAKIKYSARGEPKLTRILSERKYWEKVRVDYKSSALLLKQGHSENEPNFGDYFSELTLTPTPERSYARLCRRGQRLPYGIGTVDESDGVIGEVGSFLIPPAAPIRKIKHDDLLKFKLFCKEIKPATSTCARFAVPLKTAIELLVKGRIVLRRDSKSTVLLQQRALEVISATDQALLAAEVTRHCGKVICEEYIAYRQSINRIRKEFQKNLTIPAFTSRFAFWSGVGVPSTEEEELLLCDWFEAHPVALPVLPNLAVAVGPVRVDPSTALSLLKQGDSIMSNYNFIDVAKGEVELTLSDAVKVVTRLAPVSLCTHPYWLAVVRSAELLIAAASRRKLTSAMYRADNKKRAVMVRTERSPSAESLKIDRMDNNCSVRKGAPLDAPGNPAISLVFYQRYLRRKYSVSKIYVSDSSDDERGHMTVESVSTNILDTSTSDASALSANASFVEGVSAAPIAASTSAGTTVVKYAAVEIVSSSKGISGISRKPDQPCQEHEPLNPLVPEATLSRKQKASKRIAELRRLDKLRVRVCAARNPEFAADIYTKHYAWRHGKIVRKKPDLIKRSSNIKMYLRRAREEKIHSRRTYAKVRILQRAALVHFGGSVVNQNSALEPEASSDNSDSDLSLREAVKLANNDTSDGNSAIMHRRRRATRAIAAADLTELAGVVEASAINPDDYVSSDTDYLTDVELEELYRLSAKRKRKKSLQRLRKRRHCFPFPLTETIEADSALSCDNEEFSGRRSAVMRNRRRRYAGGIVYSDDEEGNDVTFDVKHRAARTMVRSILKSIVHTAMHYISAKEEIETLEGKHAAADAIAQKAGTAKVKAKKLRMALLAGPPKEICAKGMSTKQINKAYKKYNSDLALYNEAVTAVAATSSTLGTSTAPVECTSTTKVALAAPICAPVSTSASCVPVIIRGRGGGCVDTYSRIPAPSSLGPTAALTQSHLVDSVLTAQPPPPPLPLPCGWQHAPQSSSLPVSSISALEPQLPPLPPAVPSPSPLPPRQLSPPILDPGLSLKRCNREARKRIDEQENTKSRQVHQQSVSGSTVHATEGQVSSDILHSLSDQTAGLVGSVYTNDLVASLQALSESAMADAAAARAERQFLLNEIAFERDLLSEARNEAEHELEAVRKAFMENRMELKRIATVISKEKTHHHSLHAVDIEQKQVEMLYLEAERRPKLTEKYNLRKSVEMKETLLQSELKTQKNLSSQVRQHEKFQNIYKQRTTELTQLRETREIAHEADLAAKDLSIQQLQGEIARASADSRANTHLHQNISKTQALLEAENATVSIQLTSLQGKYTEQLQRKSRLESQHKQTWKEIYLEREAYASNVVEIAELHEDRHDLNAYFAWKEGQARMATDKSNQDMQDLFDSFKT